jgi:hypothetical protein
MLDKWANNNYVNSKSYSSKGTFSKIHAINKLTDITLCFELQDKNLHENMIKANIPVNIFINS